MAKSFKRSFGSSQAPVPEGGAFGVHLEVCQASSFSEVSKGLMLIIMGKSGLKAWS